jgi:hypothetical protein
LAYLWKLDKLKKQRLIELQEKAEKENAELKDVIEILSELFLSQSQYNKEVLNHLNDINTKINKLQMKVNEIAKFTTNEPLAQILLSNLEESDLDEDEEE